MHLQLDSNGNLHFNLQTKNGYSVMVPRVTQHISSWCR